MSTSSAPVRVLVAGAGLFGREHLERLAGRADVKLVGVADPNPAALAWSALDLALKRCTRILSV